MYNLVQDVIEIEEKKTDLLSHEYNLRTEQ